MTAADENPIVAPRVVRERYALFVVVTGTFGIQALAIVSGVITARLLGAEGRGIMALVLAIGLMASQLTFGASLPISIAKNLAERRLAARDGLRSIARRRFALLLIPCVAAGALMLVLQRADLDGDAYALAVAVAVMTFQTMTFRILTGCLQGEVGHLGRMAMAGVLPQLLFSLTLAVAWVQDWELSALHVLGMFFVASFIGLAVGLVLLARPTRRPADELDEALLWSDTRKTYFSSVRPIDGLGLDRILIGGLLGNAPLGLYAAATAVASLCSTIGSALSVIVLPQVAVHNADPAEQRAVIRRWLLLSAILITVVVIALELVAAPAIRIGFGQEFVGAIEVARWLVVADGLFAFRTVLIAVLQAQGRGGTASWIELGLTPVLIGALVAAALADSLAAVGIAMVSVAFLSCVALSVVTARGARRRGEAQPVSPPSTTIT